jgi:gluconolactonase
LLVATPAAAADPQPRLVPIASGLRFAEGPIWWRGALVVSDLIGDRELLIAKAPRTLRRLSHFANGHAVDHAGRLLVAEHAARRIARRAPNGHWITLADRFEGKRLNSPNDLIVARDGAIWFTDPPFGLKPPYGPDGVAELGFSGVYRLASDRTLRLIVGDLATPNGIGLSPDERTLYVSDTATGRLLAYPLDGTRPTARPHVLTTVPEGVDGLTVLANGNLLLAAGRGVTILDPAGRPLGRIETPEPATDTALGPDGRTLFITAGSTVWRTRLAQEFAR